MNITRILVGLAMMAGAVLAEDTITLQINGTSCSAQAWSFGASGAILPTSGATSPKTQVTNVVVTRSLDTCSVNLFKDAVTGAALATVVLTQQDANKVELMKLTLEDVVVSNYQVTGNTSSKPAESVAFAFTKITVATTAEQPNGAPGSTMTFTWDVRTQSTN